MAWSCWASREGSWLLVGDEGRKKGSMRASRYISHWWMLSAVACSNSPRQSMAQK